MFNGRPLPGDCERQERGGRNTQGACEGDQGSGTTRMAGEDTHG